MENNRTVADYISIVRDKRAAAVGGEKEKEEQSSCTLPTLITAVPSMHPFALSRIPVHSHEPSALP